MIEAGKQKKLAVLIDPEKTEELDDLIQKTRELTSLPDLFLVGGSLLTKPVSTTVQKLKSALPVPVYLFPGEGMQVCSGADGLLFLSLISGRNADFLIGQHVRTAMLIRESGMQVLPTGYILVRCGQMTSVEYMSNTRAIPAHKSDIVVSTAVAGEMLGLKALYLEAGSGAEFPIPPEIIQTVRAQVRVPIITGGGINSAVKLKHAYHAGADMAVIGNALEKDRLLLQEVLSVRDQYNK